MFHVSVFDGCNRLTYVALLVSVTRDEPDNVGVNVGSAFEIPGEAQGPGAIEDKLGDRGTEELVGAAMISKETAELVIRL